MMRFKLFVLILFIAAKSFATHNRAGYISYTWLHDQTYKFRIYTYTNPTSVGADRCEETLIFTNILSNNNIYVTCYRVNNNSYELNNNIVQLANCPQNPAFPGQGEGEILVSPYAGYGGVKVNIYEGVYTFGGVPAGGGYVFGMVDPNLDANVNNVGGGNSQNVAFALLDTLSTNNFLNYNNSPLVSNPPIDNACYHRQFCYNPGMLDPDNDSLSYSLIQFVTGDTTGGFTNAPGSSIPNGIKVDPVTGDLCWNAPYNDQLHGEYDIDMLIKEYRRNPVDGSMYQIGSMIFAVQIYVVDCTNPPINLTLSATNTCVEAGSIMQPISATASESPNPSGIIKISSTGVALTANNIGTNASFPANSGSTSVSSTLTWAPSCQAVHLNPYYFTIKGYDDNPNPNAAYSTVVVKVVSPSVQNLQAVATGDSVKLTWSPPTGCGNNTTNPITQYLIYRINDCIQYPITPCKTGVAANSGYQIIGTATASPFYDTNNGQGLPPGNTYSYIVIAKFSDGSLSMVPTYSASMCVNLHLGVPILTNVSVDTTDNVKGSIFVRWHKPLTIGVNFDTTLAHNNGSYYFSLQRKQYNVSTGTSTAYTTIYNTALKQSFYQLSTLADTTFTDTLIDTQNNQYYYKVLFYADTIRYKGTGAPASSIFVKAVGHDKKVVLNWASQTPWQDTLYYIFKQNNNDKGYTLVGSTHHTTDTVYNLKNGDNYCFKIQGIGTYNNIHIVNPDSNFSQKVCATPIDDSPPCHPVLTIVGDCDAAINKLSWPNPIRACNINDVVKYYIYYTPRQDSTLTKIDSLLNANDTTYTTGVNTQNIAGCYVVVAVDSAGNTSPLNNESCTDNCPEYELPNIFTPNGDNANDLYTPVKNRYIRSVDFTLYNRWGEIVYENTDPKLGWDGKTKQMKQMASDGVYFYTCTVNEIHYYGIKERKLKGFVQLIK
jgi:gliding motility-associated-like protein